MWNVYLCVWSVCRCVVSVSSVQVCVNIGGVWEVCVVQCVCVKVGVCVCVCVCVLVCMHVDVARVWCLCVRFVMVGYPEWDAEDCICDEMSVWGYVVCMYVLRCV